MRTPIRRLVPLAAVLAVLGPVAPVSAQGSLTPPLPSTGSLGPGSLAPAPATAPGDCVRTVPGQTGGAVREKNGWGAGTETEIECLAADAPARRAAWLTWSQPAPDKVRVVRVTSGSTACRFPARFEVTETPTTVVVTMYEALPPTPVLVCTADAVASGHTITLAAPLGGRTVVDGTA